MTSIRQKFKNKKCDIGKRDLFEKQITVDDNEGLDCGGKIKGRLDNGVGFV